MAQVVIDVPDAVVSDVLNAFADKFGYDPNNPAHGTKAQFAKACVARWTKNVYLDYMSSVAATSARISAEPAQIT